ncbi:DUF3892 domain-containing protein [Chondromyces crocatus]|uniref:DUF3892 domain-containing protein n=1 Tax=Chondromyces crocatus TaxID=52 RepID=A0A0K1EGT9_CHOCO|nr:DUF3892 domain-containing protein [Chondromyces crocatus]AKT40070.1 uncharacterized protein CMC5_042230 [Chondromyces crocatus]
MANERRVDCVITSGQTEAHQRILAIGGEYQGSRWQDTQQEAIANIETGRKSYYVKEPGGPRVEVVVGSRNGKKYLKTENDGEQPNNLLSLRECR